MQCLRSSLGCIRVSTETTCRITLTFLVSSHQIRIRKPLKRSIFCWNWFSIIRKNCDIATKTAINAQNQRFSPTQCTKRLFYYNQTFSSKIQWSRWPYLRTKSTSFKMFKALSIALHKDSSFEVIFEFCNFL